MHRHVLIACLWCFVLSTAYAAPKYDGISYTPFDSNLLGPTDASGTSLSLINLSKVGANMVALNVWWYTPSSTSTTIAPVGNSSPTMDAVKQAIDQIHSLGMQVLLKPMIDVTGGPWRGEINPSSADVPAWFTSYSSFINSFADVAQQKGVEMFSVGCELNGMEQYAANWSNVIGGVRSRYNGPLTYSATWSANGLGRGGYLNVPWWNQLDKIGIDAYFPLTNINNPTEAQLQNAWNNRANSIEAWRASSGLTNMKVLFTEAGYTSQDGTNRAPTSRLDGNPPADPQEQADCYQALLTIMSQRSWYDGAFWWNWLNQPNAGRFGPSVTDYTPQNKLAQQVLMNYYLPLKGDFNQDHVVSSSDIQPMIDALNDLSTFQTANNYSDFDLLTLGDFTGDGTINGDDLQSLRNAVPEPSSWLLAIPSLLMLCMIRAAGNNAAE